MSGISENYKNWIDVLYEKKELQPFDVKTAFNVIQKKLDDTISLDQVRKKISYLTKKGWISRIKKNTYVIVPLGISERKGYTPNSWVMANSIYTPCYIGGWTSANYWGLTEQVVNTVMVFTSKHVKNKECRVKENLFLLRQVSDIKMKEVTSTWVEGTKIFISTPTQTIVDVLDNPSISGGINHGAKIIKNYFDSEHKNIEQLLMCLKKINNKTTYKRLGYILEKMDIDEKNILETCTKNISKGFSLLDPTMKHFNQKLTYSYKWNLKINVDIKYDYSY